MSNQNNTFFLFSHQHFLAWSSHLPLLECCVRCVGGVPSICFGLFGSRKSCKLKLDRLIGLLVLPSIAPFHPFSLHFFPLSLLSSVVIPFGSLGWVFASAIARSFLRAITAVTTTLLTTTTTKSLPQQSLVWLYLTKFDVQRSVRFCGDSSEWSARRFRQGEDSEDR